MLTDCKLVRSLRKIQTNSDKHGAVGLEYVAGCALAIIADLEGGVLRPADVACLADLVVEMRNEGYAGLLAFLGEDAPDCKICAALGKQLQFASCQALIPADQPSDGGDILRSAA